MACLPRQVYSVLPQIELRKPEHQGYLESSAFPYHDIRKLTHFP